MRNPKSYIVFFGSIFVGLAVLLASGSIAYAQKPDFSGQWKQDNDRCLPKRNGEVTLQIDHRDPDLTVNTTVSRGSQNPRRALQKYSTDGTILISTGVDGDEFHTAVVWKGLSLSFSIEEHEDGRILRSTETWNLIENGETLQRIRERPNSEKQILLFKRLQPRSN